MTSTSSEIEKKSRGKNKDQFAVWTSGFHIFNLHFKVYQEKQEMKSFWKLLASVTGYENGSAVQTAANNYIRKWVEQYVSQTGPDNTGAADLDYFKITKQNKRSKQDLMELIQSYVLFFGNRKRFKVTEMQKTIKGPLVKDAVILVVNERKRTNDKIEDTQFFENKKVIAINVV